MGKYKIGIVGYGNLGKGAETAVTASEDMELCAIFSRRDNIKPVSGVPVVGFGELASWKGKLDAVILCSGSATDLPQQGPMFAKYFTTVDSFDTHAKIPEYFKAIDEVAKENGNLSLISVGWDPGMFSIMRLYNEAVLPEGNHYTFWGEGVSQGHSDALRRIDGVLNAKQYTVPVQEALDAVRNGANPQLSTRQKHKRVCYIVAKDSADKALIEKTVVEMPNYFADYDTTVNFITADVFEKEHSGMAHGGFVLRSGQTADGEKHVIEYSLKLGSNPSFTSSVLTAYARAAIRMAQNGQTGAATVFDVAPAMLSVKSGEALRKELL